MSSLVKHPVVELLFTNTHQFQSEYIQAFFRQSHTALRQYAIKKVEYDQMLF